VAVALEWLTAHASKATRDGMARYAIPSGNALGVAMKDIKALGKKLGRNHGLAQALWKSDVYEMRMLVQFVGDPDVLTASEMDRWVKSFDNWAYCDALCFNLFDRSPYAWDKVRQWSKRREEFVRRTAFALLWSLALHDRQSPDSAFEEGLALIEAAAIDERNFVKKAVSMALKAIGQRNAVLRSRATQAAKRLAASDDKTARWIGKDALTALAKRG
jgi:3-methyladenine DNA glycosylase AlkD